MAKFFTEDEIRQLEENPYVIISIQIARNESLQILLQTSITDTFVPVFTHSKPLFNKTYRELDGALPPNPRGLTLLFPGNSEKAVRPQAHCLPQTRYDARVAL